MKSLFLTVSDRSFFPGTLSAINSLLHHVDGDYEIVVVNSTAFTMSLSEAQVEALESHPKVSVLEGDDLSFTETYPIETLGPWQLKAYAAHHLTRNRDDLDLLVGFDSDLFFARDISPTMKRAVDEGKFMGGKDGEGPHQYGPEYAPYGFRECPTTTDRYMSASCYFCPLTKDNREILDHWASKTTKACYGPQAEQIYAGHGDQGVLNAVIHTMNEHKGVSVLDNRTWSQHWTFEDDILVWDEGELLNYSAQTLGGKPSVMNTVHCGGSDKFWSKAHSMKRMEGGVNQRWAYALWLRFLFFGEINPWGIDPYQLLLPPSYHLLRDLAEYSQLIGSILGEKYEEKWSGMSTFLLERITTSQRQHRMMPLASNGSMNVYVDLVRKYVPKNGVMAELGSYLGGSIATVAIACADKAMTLHSIESFMGNLDGSVDGFPLPPINRYLQNVKTIWAFQNICTTHLPSKEARKRFASRSLDFMFIDGNHSYEEVKADLLRWKTAVKTGGIIAGDDYGWDGVNQAVKEVLPHHKNKNEVWWARV